MKLVSKKNFLLVLVIAVLLAIALTLTMRSQIVINKASMKEEKQSMVEKVTEEETDVEGEPEEIEDDLDETL